MKRGKGTKNEHEEGGGDNGAPPNNPQRVEETRDERAARKAREARLMEMQLADLGVDRASAITGDDTRKNTNWVDIQALERTRAANTPGTQEYKDAQANKDHINAWQRAWKNLKDDGTHDGKYDINDGQSHREEMRKRLEQDGTITRSSGTNYYQDRSRGGVRGGRSSSSGRGGGVIGTRGRDNAVASSSRSSPGPSPAAFPNTQNNHTTIHSLRGRGAPLSTLIEETPSRRHQTRQPAPVISAVSSNLQVPRQRQALAYSLGGESGSRDAFRAAMNRPIVVTSTSPRISHSATQSDVSPVRNQQASTAISSQANQSIIQSRVLPTPNQRALPSPSRTATQPAAITVHQSIGESFIIATRVAITDLDTSTAEPSGTLFGAEIDMAPIGTRIPTPPPPQTASIRSSSAESYLTDLQGLDLSPSLSQDAWGPNATEHESGTRAEIQASEAQVSSNEREGKSRKADDDAVKPDASVKAENKESSHQTSVTQTQPARGQSPVRQTAQMLLAQLFASPDVQSDPDIAQRVAQLQTALGLLQPPRSATASREVSAAENASATAAAGSQVPTTLGTSQSVSVVHNQPATSNRLSAVVSGTTGTIRVGLTNERPTVKLPKLDKTKTGTQDHRNLTTGTAETNLTANSPTTTASSSSPARTGFAGHLQNMQQTLAESIEAALGNIPPIRGDLLDSEHSNPFFAGHVVNGRPVREQGRGGIIGNHLLPTGPQRARNTSLSSSATNLSRQATIRPHEERSIGNRRLSQSFVSPTKRINAERVPIDRPHTKANAREDANALPSQFENLHLKDRREKPTAKADFKRKASPVKVVTVSELTERYAKMPSSDLKTEEQARSPQRQLYTNHPVTNVAPQAGEQSPVARRLNGVALEEALYPFATRSVQPRAQDNEWLSLTSTSTPSVTATAPVRSSAAAAPAMTASSSVSSRSPAGSNAQVRDTPNFPDNAITRQYAQAGRSSQTNAPTQGSAQQTPVTAQRQSTLSPQAATFVAPQTSRSTASTATNVLGGDIAASRRNDSCPSAPTVPAASSVFNGNMTASRWGDTPTPTLSQTSAGGQQASTTATNALGVAFSGNMNASRWNDDAQSTVSQAPAQIEEAPAAAARAAHRGILGTSWSTENDVQITRAPPQPRVSASGTRNQAVGGGVAASRWNPNTDPGRPTRENALPIRAPRGRVTDPGIGDTSELFQTYRRPVVHDIPAFLTGDVPPTPTDPGAAVRVQYAGPQLRTLPHYTGPENQPIGRSISKSLTGSDVSPSRQESVRGRRL
ncbi:hypothetical protein MMC30_001647 [Trapelia coarctata]|nr:hypothetical protein [Trapelia coarctata]